MSTESAPEGRLSKEEYKELSTKGSAGVIGFLRELNFGSNKEFAETAVDRAIEYFEPGTDKKGGKFKLNDPQNILPELAHQLKEAGFGTGKLGWQQVRANLTEALVDYNKKYPHGSDQEKAISRHHQSLEV